jgi:hypothetical protein
MATDPDEVNAAFFDELRKYYSDDEIVELGARAGSANLDSGISGVSA